MAKSLRHSTGGTLSCFALAMYVLVIVYGTHMLAKWKTKAE